MKKDKVIEKFQRLGKVLMAPVLILPIAGILVGIGNAFMNPNVIKVLPALNNPFFSMVFAILKGAGNVVMGNISVIFAICVAYGFAKSEKATAALSGFLGYMTMNSVMGIFLTKIGVIDPKNLTTGQSVILGVSTLDTGVIGGLLIGLCVSYLHNKYYKIELPAVLSVFNGTRFIPAVTIVASSLLGIVLSFVFPPIQHGLSMASEFIRNTGTLGSFVYGISERLLLPFGLHHFIYLPFFFTSLGGTMNIGGTNISGAINIYNAILNTPGEPFNIAVSRFVMNGKVIFAMFGLPGAALAFYKTALPENKKKIGSLMIAAIIPCFIMGITEPLEYAFLFVAPVLFGLHAILCGAAYAIAYLLNFNVAGSTTFGGPLLSFIFNGILGADKGSNYYWLLIIGPIYFLVYYFSFKFIILKKDLKTPGRVPLDDVDEQKIQDKHCKVGNLIPGIIEAVGGKDNIVKVDACFTRLRLQLKDVTLVQADSVFTDELGASGVVKVNQGIQIIYGNKASVYKTELRELLELE